MFRFTSNSGFWGDIIDFVSTAGVFDLVQPQNRMLFRARLPSSCAVGLEDGNEMKRVTVDVRRSMGAINEYSGPTKCH